jgi:hypothetical protein
VTSVMPKYVLDNNPISSLGISKSLDNVIKQIRHEAKKRNLLQGMYRIYLQPIENFKLMKPILIDESLSYIERTKSQAYTPKEAIMSPNGKMLCSIKKVHNDKNFIDVIKYSRLGQPWEGGIEKKLHELIHERLNEKTHKLRDIEEPIILLLWDDYHKAKTSSWVESISSQDTSKFHTIARVFERDGQLYCQIIQSKVEEWLIRSL